MNKRSKTLKIFTAVILIGAIVYLLGPKPNHPEYSPQLPNVPALSQLEDYVKKIESQHKIKPGNEAEIVWADSSQKQQSDYAVVYLHGYTASKAEGNPTYFYLAKLLHANLYLARLADHGVDTVSAMKYSTPDRLWESAKQAFEIGKRLGKKVIIIGTSTGGTLALKLAATYPDVNSLILISPNIEINDKLAFMLNNPWGLQIARMVIGSKERVVKNKTRDEKKYWYSSYRLESTVQLQELLETSMNKTTFEKVTQPVLLLYYYKNEKEQDHVVRVSAELRMFDQLGTPVPLKTKVAIPNGGSHVLGSYMTSKDIPSVERAIGSFVKNVLKLTA
ncbi:MAG: alpha/beta fold hydrolase [Candidatus Pedobacter colombiensis]|uniref:Alpha/beta fold hydrolase n=1 Tax=Candidatus Pedobacter colombiensis TaxID=3121371 RepID=A0AAJ5W8A9_9SPHI|nr:alpha/beta fold hydrolase [Pedobacter sp.]WEK19809.1 MAG: alpha/beta fold hydrolase [Pedobacter sp.]